MPPEPVKADNPAPLQKVPTPGAATIEAVGRLLGVPAGRMLKTMLYDAGGTTVAVLLPGDREVEEAKLARFLFPSPVRRLEDADFSARGLPKGYVGPQGLGDEVSILADHAVTGGADWVTGANEPNHHVTGANTPRDFRVDRYEDLVALRDGDRCPVDGGELRVGRSIVVGHIYQLGTRYSGPLKATFVDEDGSERPYQMGSHGIGISRILAAAAEQFHDEAGLRLPRALTPFDIVVIAANADDERVAAEADRVYRELVGRGQDGPPPPLRRCREQVHDSPPDRRKLRPRTLTGRPQLQVGGPRLDPAPAHDDLDRVANQVGVGELHAGRLVPVVERPEMLASNPSITPVGGASERVSLLYHSTRTARRSSQACWQRRQISAHRRQCSR
jgi:Aminoacyl-tRNA editing domain